MPTLQLCFLGALDIRYDLEIERLQRAVVLYGGDFLDGFCDDWIINEQYRLETLVSEALARLMVGQEARLTPHWPRPCGCYTTTHCGRTRTGWRCAPIAGWGSARFLPRIPLINPSWLAAPPPSSK